MVNKNTFKTLDFGHYMQLLYILVTIACTFVENFISKIFIALIFGHILLMFASLKINELTYKNKLKDNIINSLNRKIEFIENENK